MAPEHGQADYVLYVNRQVVGVIEAKPMGTALSGVEWQSGMYASGLPKEDRIRAKLVDGSLPFVFEASGTETHFTNGFDRSLIPTQTCSLTRFDAQFLLYRGGLTSPAGCWVGQWPGTLHRLTRQNLPHSFLG